MREPLLAGLLLVALAGSGAASDLPVKAPPPAAAYDWTGFYMGGHLGYAAGWSNWSASQAGTTASSLSGTLNFIDAYNFSTGAGNYLLGFQAGYNYMAASRWLVGVETDGSFPNSLSGNRTFISALSGEANYLEDVEFSGTMRGRIGYAPGNWLFYVTGGFAWSYDQFTRTQIVGVPTGGTPLPGAIENLYLVPRVGGVVGAGVEVALTPNLAVRLEYLYTDYANRSVTFPAGVQRFDSDLTLQTLRVGLDYKFGHGDIDPEIFTKGMSALELDRFAFHGQSTFIEQYDFPFRSPNLGPHSLNPNQGRESLDFMYFVGIKLWQGAEFWVDPEIDQGFGLSNTEGIAGFPSGASFKVGASVPYSRIERAFVRQTIDLGGVTQKVDADQNQFAGSQTADRLVVTIGKFSVLDSAFRAIVDEIYATLTGRAVDVLRAHKDVHGGTDCAFTATGKSSRAHDVRRLKHDEFRFVHILSLPSSLRIVRA